MTAGGDDVVKVMISVSGANAMRRQVAKELRLTLDGETIVVQSQPIRLRVICYVDDQLGEHNEGADINIMDASVHAAASSDFIVVLVDAGYINSRYCRAELTTGLARGARFIFLADENPKHLKGKLRNASLAKTDSGLLTAPAEAALALLYDGSREERKYDQIRLSKVTPLCEFLQNSITNSLTSRPLNTPADRSPVGPQSGPSREERQATDLTATRMNCTQPVMPGSPKGVECDLPTLLRSRLREIQGGLDHASPAGNPASSGTESWADTPARRLLLDWILADLDGHLEVPEGRHWFTGVLASMGVPDRPTTAVAEGRAR